MVEYFSNMETAQSIYWYIAIGASLVFVLLTIVSFIGGGDTDVDADADVDSGESPFHIFSFRNIINFLLGFGWTGVVFYKSINNHILLTAIAIVVGAIFVFAFLLVVRSFFGLAENNTFKLEDTIGQTGDVYLKIPANKTGRGKVLISIKGSVRELEAVTMEENTITTGKTVKVVALDGTNLIVESI